MTGAADYTEEEWKQVLEGPTSAGLLVITADKGGTFRETFSMAKAYTEARQKQGQSELLDTIAATKPVVDKDRGSSPEEMKTKALANIGEAVAVLEQKATPEEIEDYRRFVIALAERVASAHKEHGQEISDKERAAIDEIAAALGA